MAFLRLRRACARDLGRCLVWRWQTSRLRSGRWASKRSEAKAGWFLEASARSQPIPVWMKRSSEGKRSSMMRATVSWWSPAAAAERKETTEALRCQTQGAARQPATRSAKPSRTKGSRTRTQSQSVVDQSKMWPLSKHRSTRSSVRTASLTSSSSQKMAANLSSANGCAMTASTTRSWSSRPYERSFGPQAFVVTSRIAADLTPRYVIAPLR
mmetsp:Transcript_23613/g.73887  ORF Transcript_23613/g.73887 Transcript_23613/m.73887 type:complete len:212 (+) Transcript_23613:1191-1826(+)